MLATPEGVRLVRAGAQRWLVVNAPAEKVWPVIREFWTDQGFAVRKEDAQLGVMETEWIDSDAVSYTHLDVYKRQCIHRILCSQTICSHGLFQKRPIWQTSKVLAVAIESGRHLRTGRIVCKAWLAVVA